MTADTHRAAQFPVQTLNGICSVNLFPPRPEQKSRELRICTMQVWIFVSGKSLQTIE
jgi:hypothetical protein